MDNVFMVIANYESRISYGVDSAAYLCGIYETKEEAETRIKNLSSIVEDCQKELKDYKEELSSGEYDYLNITDWLEEDPEDAIYHKYAELLGFGVRPYLNDSWDVTFELKEQSLGDITDCILGGASYAE